MISLVCAIVMMAQATPASAAINFSGDAQVRPRGEFTYYNDAAEADGAENTAEMKYLYRVRLHAAADLGDGYFAKAMIASQTPGWLATAGTGNEAYNEFDLGVSQLYFGRMMEDSHYMMGKMPLNSFNNPVFDISLSPFQATELPVFLNYNDALYGFNYGTKIGPGELNATLSVLDNDLTTEDMFEDGYGLHVMYKTNIGNVTFEPQMLAALSDADTMNYWVGGNADGYENVKPLTFGANISVPADDVTFCFSGFYTQAEDEDNAGNDVDYSGYLLRAKAVYGPLTTWIDYNAAEDDTNGADVEYNNLFVWAQYKYTVHESSMGTFTLSPTVRYLTNSMDDGTDELEGSRLRTELWANVTF